MENITLSDIQHPSFVSPAMQLGLERSIFEPLRLPALSETIGREAPNRLTPLPFGDLPAVAPGPAFIKATGLQDTTYGQSANIPAYLASGFSGGYDPSDIDPETGKPMFHQPSLFKTMASPTRFLTPETVSPQMAIPFNAKGMAFDTKRAIFSPHMLAPSNAMIDIYHKYKK